jgi:putative addiction module component (TIGR02574 family)
VGDHSARLDIHQPLGIRSRFKLRVMLVKEGIGRRHTGTLPSAFCDVDILNADRVAPYPISMATMTQHDINDLNAKERLALIGRLWDSLIDVDLPLPETQRAELEERVASFEEDRFGGVTWDNLKSELAARAP